MLVAKSLGRTVQAPVLGTRAWDHSSGPKLETTAPDLSLGRELGSELGPKLGRGLGRGLRTAWVWGCGWVWMWEGVSAALLPAHVPAQVLSSRPSSRPELTSQVRSRAQVKRSGASEVASRLVTNTPTFVTLRDISSWLWFFPSILEFF